MGRNRMLKGNIAIAGVGASRQGKLPGETPLSLGVEAFKAALKDSGISKDEIDGLLTMPGTRSPEGATHFLRIGEELGINPRYAGSKSMGGATAIALIAEAAMAISAGLANTVACIFGDTPKTGGYRFDRAAGATDSWAIWGMLSAAANSAVTASRHMALYGTKSEQLAEVAVACRYHASLNPNAYMRQTMTIEDHQNSRMVVDPLRLFDCCLITDGAACIIVTSAERARDLKSKPVYVSGVGQAHTLSTLDVDDWWYCPHQRTAVETAYKMAGVGPGDIDVAQLYDNFSISVLLWLEHGGFCKAGEAGAFVEGGRIRLGGDLPVNTAGGNLSESYLQGWLHVVEGVRQIRGECDQRQVDGAEVCLVTGRGMTLNCASALILTGSPR